MNNTPIGRYRSTPLHFAATPYQEADTSPETKDLQQDAPEQLHAAEAVETSIEAPLPQASEYTISVEQVREHLRQKGLQKSKDTIQRWCRAGDLDCRKQGLLNRFFTTEASLKALEARLLPDMIADQVGAASQAMQPDAAAGSDLHSDRQVHAAASSEVRTGMKAHEAASALLPNEMQAHAAEDEAARTSEVEISIPASVEVAKLKAQVAGLTSQLEQAQAMSKFLQEEIVSARGQRGDVVKIAEQMLGTLETIAVGGRLEASRPNQSSAASQPVRYQHPQPEAGGV